MGFFSSELIFERRKDGLKVIKKNKKRKVTIADFVNDVSDIGCRMDSKHNGWWYVIDDTNKKVYNITFYRYNKLEELNKKGAVILPVNPHVTPLNFP